VLESVAEDVEEPSLVLGCFSLPGAGHRLAWKAGADNTLTHDWTKLSVWESGNIREDRCRIKESCFNLFNQVPDGECFPLAVSDCAKIWDCFVESKADALIT
jgi:hypothetical protein